MTQNNEPRKLEDILNETWDQIFTVANAVLARKIDKLVREAYDRGRKDAR